MKREWFAPNNTAEDPQMDAKIGLQSTVRLSLPKMAILVPSFARFITGLGLVGEIWGQLFRLKWVQCWHQIGHALQCT